MKKVFVFISIMSFVACTAPEAVEKRVGFGGEAGKLESVRNPVLM